MFSTKTILQNIMIRFPEKVYNRQLPKLMEYRKQIEAFMTENKFEEKGVVVADVTGPAHHGGTRPTERYHSTVRMKLQCGRLLKTVHVYHDEPERLKKPRGGNASCVCEFESMVKTRVRASVMKSLGDVNVNVNAKAKEMAVNGDVKKKNSKTLKKKLKKFD